MLAAKCRSCVTISGRTGGRLRWASVSSGNGLRTGAAMLMQATLESKKKPGWSMKQSLPASIGRRDKLQRSEVWIHQTIDILIYRINDDVSRILYSQCFAWS